MWFGTSATHYIPINGGNKCDFRIIIVGAVLQIAQPTGNFFIDILAFIAILVASINIFGGFKVTQRMLAMFRKG